MGDTRLPELDWKHDPLFEAFQTFKARLEVFFIDREIVDDEKKANKLQLAIGNEGMRRILASGLSDNDRKDPAKIWTMLENQIDASVKVNFRVHRLEFAYIRQKPEEPFCEFINRLRTKAQKCEFEATENSERIIEMITLNTQYEELRKEILSKPKGADLKDILDRALEFEAIHSSQNVIKKMNGPQNVDAIRHATQTRKPCGNCARFHQPRSCPAFVDTCSACGTKGHWSKCCRKTKTQSQNRSTSQTRKGKWKGKPKKQQKSQNEVQFSKEEDDPTLFHLIEIRDLPVHNIDKEVFIDLEMRTVMLTKERTVSGKLRVKVDTGSAGNTLPMRTYKQMFQSTPTKKILKSEPHVKLTSYNGGNIPCHGSILIELKKECQDTYLKEKFYVVDVEGPAILGLSASKKLGIVQLDIHATSCREEKIETIDDVKKEFPNCFDGIGHFRQAAQLNLKDNAVPHTDAPRKFPIHFKEKIKEELDRMVKDSIIEPVAHHTDWCSSITYVAKPDGSLRICLDPRRLNSELKRCPHKIPTVEELTPTLCHSKFFSKLDAKAGYWSVPLTESSQDLTTFRTPYGRYRFKRLPFGLNVSQDIYQQRMDSITSQSEGCVGISDDIIVHGRNKEEHDRRLRNFLKIAEVEGLKMNSKKCKISTSEISFFGRKITKDGITPDPKKVTDINNLPQPTGKEDVRRTLGMINFLGNHIPNCASKTANLRALLQENSIFLWEPVHEQEFNALKEEIAKATTLNYYDPQKETTLEVDASSKGIGAALIQNNRPIAFASKSLTSSESNYSNIERECLAVLYGIQRFHHYLFGKHFIVITDHQPLEMIFLKPNKCASPRLRRMIIRTHGYNFTIKYRKGETMILADTLSRAPNPMNNEEIPLDTCIDDIIIEVDLMHFSKEKRAELREETVKDNTLYHLSKLIHEGWPDNIQDIPREVRDHWSYRDELAMENGIIFKGQQVVIPPSMRKDILSQLHMAHQGIEKTRLLARETVFWPRINQHIEETCSSCELCQQMQPKQAREPMQMHEKPAVPWTKIATDLFQIGQQNFLIIGDYFTKYPVVVELKSTTSKAIIEHTKDVISIFGCPRTIMSDNGPQYGQEFKNFCQQWGIEHITSSPRRPQGNGFIERMIRYVKPIITKCQKEGRDWKLALLNVRATPIDRTMPSPAELMFGRPVATALPSRHDIKRTSQYQDHMNAVAEKQKDYSNTRTVPLPKLQEQQPVRVLDEGRWKQAQVVMPHSDRSYIIEDKDGRILRRNRQQIKRVSFKDPIAEPVSSNSSGPIAMPFAMPISNSLSNNSPVTASNRSTRSGRVIKKPERYAN